MWRSIWAALSPSGRRFSAHGPALALALLCTAASAANADIPGEPLLLAVSINGVDSGAVVAALPLADGGLAVAERDLRAWRLNPPAGAALRAGGEPYVRLADLPGIEYRIDTGSQTLLLRVPATAFAATAFTHGGKGIDLTPSRPGGFFNYDLNWQRDGGRDNGGGLFEIGAFNALGSGTATGLWNSATPRRRWVRLDTTWNVDMPERMESLRFGDAIGRADGWGRAVRFGGIQWASNFATQPGFIAFPLPTLRGEAALPSTLDVYLDNARLLHGDIPPGPFDLANVPTITGQGELRLVVRDLLGRQQVISQPYYASPHLLKPGLRDFSYEFGAVREDYGVASARYGRLMLAATDRLGISPGFTRELRAELLADQQTLGAGGVWLLPQFGAFHLGVLNFGAAVSHSSDGLGRLFALGVERQARDVSVNFQAQHVDREFVQLGRLPGSSPRNTLAASLGLPLGGNGLGLGYMRRSTWEGEGHRLLSASYSLRLGAAGQLGLHALRDLSGDSWLSLGLIWTMALDQRTSLSADLSRQDGRSRTTLQAQRNPPAGNGFGYRLLAGDDEHYQAGATLQTDRATFTAETARFASRNGYRAGVSGGIAVAGGRIFPSLRIDDSFAVVKVGDYAGVRVYRDNQEVTRTDAQGLALITRLRAYQENPVGIEQADLPIDAEVEALQLKLTPALRSGVVVDFPVRRSRNASFRLVGDDGLAVPPGAVVRIKGDTREFPVGFDGRAFVTGLDTKNRVEAEWDGRRCIADLALDDPDEPLPDLGILTCKGTTP
ncbi:MAG: fimbria/pilus outer membrane usher protein [Candidatus Nitricoxidivorans perseverans]|uniref:Fimbria/pilus outer membrane usher protein n=1 Tax=Candidatus Nitricoxidivorans perseverans TaxID=2975601 RepID=A0AA49FM48_9PROT|nr:MAG: fimbria/pilus outer membrane usher protein [Candidatus Nitricoxidivorans perseverans]